MNKLLSALAFFLKSADEVYINLIKQGTTAKIKYVQNGKTFTGLAVTHKDLVFMVLIDEKGEYEIYLIEEDTSTLIWSRDS